MQSNIVSAVTDFSLSRGAERDVVRSIVAVGRWSGKKVSYLEEWINLGR